MNRMALLSGGAVIRYLLVFFFLLAVITEANSMPVGSAAFLDNAKDDNDLASVQRVLESKMIAGKLKELGLSQGDIEKRLKSLTDEELHQFAASIDSLYAGGDAGGVMIVVAVVMMGIMLYYILTGGHMMGHGH